MKATRLPTGPPSSRTRAWTVTLLLTAVFAPLFLYGLGDTMLWGDEGHTLLLGRSVLEHGFPFTNSGAESLSVARGGEAGLLGLHVQIPFLQAYVAAGSLAILGESPFAARFPFALAGLLCLPLAYLVARSHTRREVTGIVAATLVGLNPFFLLYARQARYYALAALLLLCVLAAPAWPRRWRGALFAAALVLLVLTFDPTALAVIVALIVLGVGPLRIRLGMDDRAYWTGLLIGGMSLVAWLALASTAPRSRVPDLLAAVARGVPFQLAYVNAHVLPCLVALPAALLWWWHRHDRPDESRVSARAVACFMLVGGLVAMAGALPPDRFARYAVPGAPVLSLALAVLIVQGLSGVRHARLWQAVVVGLVVLTNVPFAASHSLVSTIASAAGVTVTHKAESWSTPLIDLLGELQDPPLGPIHGVVEFLATHAAPGDTIVVTYGDLALRAQTPLEVYGFWSGLPQDDVPWDWIWMRTTREGPLDVRTDFEARLDNGRYRRHELDVADRHWENRPDPHLHVFGNPGPDAPPVVLWERIR